MKPEQQRIAIAEFCGWRIETLDHSTFVYAPGKKEWNGYRISDTRHSKIIALLPDYLNDLNAMHEAEIAAGLHYYPLCEHYYPKLIEVKDREGSDFPIWMATAAQRAEAFLKTVGRWEESE